MPKGAFADTPAHGWRVGLEQGGLCTSAPSTLGPGPSRGRGPPGHRRVLSREHPRPLPARRQQHPPPHAGCDNPECPRISPDALTCETSWLRGGAAGVSPSPSLPTQAARVPRPLPLRKSTRSPVHPSPRGCGIPFVVFSQSSPPLCPGRSFFSSCQERCLWDRRRICERETVRGSSEPGPEPRPHPSERRCLSCHTLGPVLPELGTRVSVEAVWSGRPALPQVPLLTQDGGGRQRSARAQVYRCVFHGGQVWKRSPPCLLTEGHRSTNRS
ncbi:hypothetical protein HJG60_008917 [Phyllostomus discolor]|uniref:Uncharacterized protein n=1 Tax=Phyllostomus discolor TaxID=89673 RepID=A0A834DJ30_9CHIR|nr:hypothetical protein HJG60_008917 [Phyllostomus discolor]